MRIRNINHSTLIITYSSISSVIDMTLTVTVYLYSVHPKALGTMYNEIFSLVYSFYCLFSSQRQVHTRDATIMLDSSANMWYYKMRVINNWRRLCIYSWHQSLTNWLLSNKQRSYYFLVIKIVPSNTKLLLVNNHTTMINIYWVPINTHLSSAVIHPSLGAESVCLLSYCASNFTAADPDNNDTGSNGGHTWKSQSYGQLPDEIDV